ncbi:hypothetical protein AWC38_SpisGene6700 [Stylophora pistillata]|uniref:Uncharacterized protein n=1 Tax=Stylophora pistillata TaxID=50429 RepID=A0A2B4SCZ6_STYPI|nr:hypothetical protein AWC38_SpisGene6700 [Stylophora pistillata]
MQKRIKEFQTKPALAMEREEKKCRENELALKRKKPKEEAHLELLRLEREAVVAAACAKAIDEELGFKQDELLSHLPIEEPSNRVQEFINSQLRDVKPACDFMARRELISNKIEKFDNRPENYTTWRATFRNMTREVNITGSEELALMIEHTTGEPKRLVQRLCNAYAENPAAGVREFWKKLSERFGSTAVVTQVHPNKLIMFPTLTPKDNKGLQELGDLLLELQCAKQDGGLTGLKILDEPAFLKPLLAEIPSDLQSKKFASFIQEIAREQNDPYLPTETLAEESQQPRPPLKPPKSKLPKGPPIRPPSMPPAEPANGLTFRHGLTTMRTELSDTTPKGSTPQDPAKGCALHKLRHPLGKGRVFRSKSLTERKAPINQHRICFCCLASTNHMAKDCTAVIKCSECQSDKHMAALHTGPINEPTTKAGQLLEAHQQGEEAIQVSARCTEICGSAAGNDQSNSSLAKPKLFDLLKLNGEAKPYTLKTCSGASQASGRRAHDLIIESLDVTRSYTLPILAECKAIPDSREEIPTPNVARAFPHLQPIADEIPELCPGAEILLLIRRDTPPLHKIHESRNGPKNAPWAQRLDLGWVVIGNTCLDGAHKPNKVSAYWTQILHNGQPSCLLPCTNWLRLKNSPLPDSTAYLVTDKKKRAFVKGKFKDGLGDNVFPRSVDDNKPGMSMEDRKFINIMNHSLTKSEMGHWEAPLPLTPGNKVSRWELHTFCDASNEAVGAVSYLKTIQDDGNIQVSFVLGKAKLAPSHATTVPCLELSTAMLGVEIVELIIEELDIKPEVITYYSDSRVVLGYITNESRCFYVYVSNQVERIRRALTREQWRYLPTQQNPANLATWFSKWIALIKAVAKLILFVQKSQKSRTSESPEMTPSVPTLLKAKYLVIQNVQRQCYKEISFLTGPTKSPKTSLLIKLSPVTDN